MEKRTKYQEKIIKNFYRNREDIAVQRLLELVTDLYLATGKKRQQHWKNIVGHLENLKVPQQQIDHLVQEDNPELVLTCVNKFLTKP